MASTLSLDVRQRLGKRRYSPDRQRSPSPSSTSDTAPAREPTRDVHRRLGVAIQDGRGPFSTSPKDKKTSMDLFLIFTLCPPWRSYTIGLYIYKWTDHFRSKLQPHFLPAGGLWSRLGSGNGDCSSGHHEHRSSSQSPGFSSSTRRSRDDRVKEEEKEVLAPAEEEDDSTLQKMWGAMIKQKQERLSHKMKKSRLDNLPSLQIEISRDSSEESDAWRWSWRQRVQEQVQGLLFKDSPA